MTSQPYQAPRPKRTWQAVAPIKPHSCLPSREHPLGPAVLLTGTPQWFSQEVFQRPDITVSPLSLVSTFEADSFGDALPGASRSLQQEAVSAIQAAMLALAIAKPSPLHFDCLHIRALTPGPDGSSASQTQHHPPFLPDRAYARNVRLTLTDLGVADTIATALHSIPRGSALWTAARFFAIALSERLWEIRTLDVWVGIEALFGPEDRRDITERLAVRAARLLNPANDAEALNAYQIVKRAYDWRCEVSHGARLTRPPAEIERCVLESESILRSALLRIFREPTTIQEFSSLGRDAYLETISTGFPSPRTAPARRRRRRGP